MPFPPELERCYNCGILKHSNNKFITDLTVEHQNILSLWTGQHVPEGAEVCVGCITKIEDCKNNENPVRQFGHQEICAACGKSVIKKRTCIKSGSSIQILFPWYHQYKELKPDHYLCCHACHQKITRKIKVKEEAPRPAIEIDFSASESPNEPSFKNEIDFSDGPTLNMETDLSTSKSNNRLPSHNTTNIDKKVISKKGYIQTKVAIFQEDQLVLPTYFRAPVSRRKCIVPKCTLRGTTIPRANRKLIFLESEKYIQGRATLCEKHTHHDYHAKYGYNYFSIDFIEDILTMIEKPVSIINFDVVNDMPEHICKYWTGLTVEEFKDLYQKLNIDTGSSRESLKNALAAHLLRKKTGDSIIRIANLFLMTTHKLSRQLEMIEKCFETLSGPQLV